MMPVELTVCTPQIVLRSSWEALVNATHIHDRAQRIDSAADGVRRSLRIKWLSWVLPNKYNGRMPNLQYLPADRDHRWLTCKFSAMLLAQVTRTVRSKQMTKSKGSDL